MSKTSSDAERPDVGKTPRRKFVFFGALAAAALLPGTAGAQGRLKKKKKVAEPVDQLPAEPLGAIAPNENVAAFAEWDTGGLSRLVRRVTMGITRAEMTRAQQMGWNGYLNYQLNYTRIDDSVAEAVVASKYPYMSQPSDALFTISQTDNNGVFNQLRDSTLYRAAFSQRQLYQRMVEFWSDHFNQDLDKVQYLLVADQRDVIRKYAMTSVPQIVKASAHSAAMMLYLDQNVSSAKAPNQNYAREIMELHTLGVDGGYTQDDVAELSRIFTGWTVTGRGVFSFLANLHDTGNKVLMGKTFTGQSGAGAIAEGEAAIDMLVAHPSTARFIATKMLKWMVTPTPTESQINAISAVYRATSGDIKSMLRAMLNEEWLSQAPMKLKRPFHLTASALRALNPTVVSLTSLSNSLNTLGHLPFAWDTPDGYPDKLEYWAGNIVPRWSFGSQFSNFNSVSTLQVDTAPYRAGSTAAAIDLIDQNFFGGEMPAVTRTGLTTYINGGTFNDTRMRETIGLALSSNAFQWY
jgi:uncharacterized protein (DUF1800 family)